MDRELRQKIRDVIERSGVHHREFIRLLDTFEQANEVAMVHAGAFDDIPDLLSELAIHQNP